MNIMAQRQMRVLFPYHQTVVSTWNPSLADCIHKFRKKMEKATEIGIASENERILQFLEAISLTNGKVCSIERRIPKEFEVVKGQEKQILITVEFATPEDEKDFEQDYQNMMEEGIVL